MLLGIFPHIWFESCKNSFTQEWFMPLLMLWVIFKTPMSMWMFVDAIIFPATFVLETKIYYVTSIVRCCKLFKHLGFHLQYGWYRFINKGLVFLPKKTLSASSHLHLLEGSMKFYSQAWNSDVFFHFQGLFNVDFFDELLQIVVG